tara:strand:+ start:1971 stop:2759 length:789 start_codon:yes stop_codon:yes gene_type:complete
MSTNDHNNIVVFDMDETLGYFYELSIFWSVINRYYDKYISDKHFVEILDLYPEFIRPNIIRILKIIIKYKSQNKCSKIMMYTNNQGERKWIQLICKYFDTKIKTKIFDQIIAAFKANGEKIEICRTTHDKSVSDLIKCSNIPENTRICFIDDQYHSLMKTDNVYYINVKPYEYSLDFQEMALRYYNKFTSNITSKKEFVNFVIKNMTKSGYIHVVKNKTENNIDKIVSKKLLTYIKEFFNESENKNTKKHRRKQKNKTKKNI